MANIENLKAFDPFADAAKGNDEGVQDGLVHIRYTKLILNFRKKRKFGTYHT